MEAMSKGLQIACGAAACVLLLGWYASSVLESGAALITYYQTLEEFQAAAAVSGSGLYEQPSRVHGYVAPGSIDRDVEARAVRFAVQSTPPHGGGAALEVLRVEYGSLEVPDLFKDGAEVVVEGRLEQRGEPLFRATNVLAKCPSKFEAMRSEARSEPL